MRLLGLGRSGAQRRFLARFGRNGGRGQGVGSRWALLFPRRYQSSPTAVFQPITLPTDVDGRQVMQQPVQNGGRDDRVSENRTPVPEHRVSGSEVRIDSLALLVLIKVGNRIPFVRTRKNVMLNLGHGKLTISFFSYPTQESDIFSNWQET